LYFRFSLSFRDIQEMMLERGVSGSYEAIRLWCPRSVAEYARRLRRQRGRPGDMWHLDEVFGKINGEMLYLWRAVDQSGEVLDVLVQKRRDAKAAKRFFRRLLKGHLYLPRAIVADRLARYAAARKDLIPSVAHNRGRLLNNRTENSHQPTRERERFMRRFQSMKQAQRFPTVHAQVSNHFRPGRHSMRACHYRTMTARPFASWSEITGMSRPTTISP
jgi:putative transposase